jgi:hypothetical protein
MSSLDGRAEVENRDWMGSMILLGIVAGEDEAAVPADPFHRTGRAAGRLGERSACQEDDLESAPDGGGAGELLDLPAAHVYSSSSEAFRSMKLFRQDSHTSPWHGQGWRWFPVPAGPAYFWLAG